MFTYEELKQRHRLERDDYLQALSIRVHRALSWLNKAEQCEDDDSKFTFLWIAFNSAYAQEIDHTLGFGEKGLYKEFLAKLVELDTNQLLYKTVWENYSGSIRHILNNEYILAAFWSYHSGRVSESEWKKSRSNAISAANFALSNSDTVAVLSIVFNRLYVLRNQIIHGGATFGSKANRKQLKECTQVLESIVPIIISLMMDGCNQLWGEPVYPLVQD